MIFAANKKDLKQAKRVAKKWASVDIERVIAYGEGKDDKSEEIAKAMLKKSDISYISKVTGLSIEVIKELQQS